MSADLETTIHDYHAAWRAHDVERICTFFTDDCFYEHVPSGVEAKGLDEMREVVADIFRAIPDLELDLRHVSAGKDSAITEWGISGTLAEDLADVKATGETFTLRTASVIEFRGDKICRLSSYWDLSVLRHPKE